MDSKIHLYEYRCNILNILLAAGAMYEDSYNAIDVLNYASWKNHSDTVKLLINTGVNPNKWGSFFSIPLVTACEYGSIDVVKILIEAGCNLDARGYKGRTALMTAAYHGHSNIVHLLIEAGADLVTTNSHRDTALDIARIEKRKYIATILEQAMKEQGYAVSAPR